MDIKINEANETITISEKTDYNEDSLLERFRQDYMELMVREKMMERAPQVDAMMKMHIDLSEAYIEQNQKRQDLLKEIFDKLEINIPKRIAKIKEKYTEADFLSKAKNILQTTELSIIKDEDKFVMRNDITQSVEDLILEFMNLQDSKPSMISKLMKQKESLANSVDKTEKLTKEYNEFKQRMKAIEERFAKQGKDVNKLLDLKAQARKREQKIAERLPAQ